MPTSLELRAQELAYRKMADVVRLSRVRLITVQIKTGTYEERAALPVVAERLIEELDDDVCGTS